MLWVFFYSRFVISIMTTKSLSLTAHSRFLNSLFADLTITLTILLSTFGSAFLILATPSAATAKDEPQITESLPPPPPIAPHNQLVKHKHSRIIPIDTNPPIHTRNKNQPREYTFTAPNESAVEDRDSNAIQGYKVEVFGDTEGLLAEIQNIEPKAFQQGNIIQVGVFSDRDNAENLVRKLATKGFWSRIIRR